MFVLFETLSIVVILGVSSTENAIFDKYKVYYFFLLDALPGSSRPMKPSYRNHSIWYSGFFL